MSKIKPYIVTVKYITFETEPPFISELVDAHKNGMGVDVLEASFEEAMVIAKPKSEAVAAPKLAPGHTIHTVPVVSMANIHAGGSSEKVLKALAGGGPRTVGEIKALTGLTSPNVNVLMSRLKKLGRIKIGGKGPYGSIYEFVK